MATTIIIGGTGLLGPSLVQLLEHEGVEVICVNRSGKHPSGGRAYKCDRSSAESLKSVFDEHKSFSLVDMIPFSASNAGALIDALEGRQVPITAISSIDVYEAYNIFHKTISGPIQPTPLTEESELRTRLSFQGASYDKLNVEKIYWSYFDSCNILRMPAIYGLPDTSRISYYSEQIFAQGKVALSPDFGKWVFSRSSNVNCAHAVALCSNHVGREVFNVAEERDYSEQEWCERIARIAGRDVKIEYSDKVSSTYDVNPKQHWFVDSSKIRNQLGYREIQNPEDAISEVLQQLHGKEDF